MKKINLILALVISLSAKSQLDTINIGTNANDGTGDAVRTAFSKINSNDQYLDSIKVDSNDVISIISEQVNNDSLVTTIDNNFNTLTIDVTGVLSTLTGIVSSDGTLNTSSSSYKSTVLYPITENQEFMRITNTTSNSAVNYVNCYHDSTFSAFLGRTDDTDWASLSLSSDTAIDLKLKKGTKYISFLTYSPNVPSLEIASADVYTHDGFNNSEITQGNYNKIYTNPTKYTLSGKYQEEPLRFKIPVNCNIANVDSNTIEFQDTVFGYDTKQLGSLSKVTGFILENGTIDSTTYTTFKSAKPIEIDLPNGGFVVFTNTDTDLTPNYVNCYGSDNFGDFIGRSGDSAWATVTIDIDYRNIKMEIPDGTKYISFVTDSPNTVNDLTTSDIFSIVENNYDWGMLMLPETYNQTGLPTRLIVGAHGAGGSVDEDQSPTEDLNLYKYLCANGYAILDMNGLPSDFAAAKQIDIKNNLGSPIAVEAYIKGVEYVLNNYNLCKDGVLVCGGSMGGLSSSNLVMSEALNVLAHGIVAPVTDAYNHVWLNPWSGVLTKTAMINIYNLAETTPGSGTYVYSEDKVKGYNPMLNGMLSFNSTTKLITDNVEVTTSTAQSTLQEYKSYPCPIKIWHCVDDPIVAYSASQRHITSIRNAGQIAFLRSLPSGGHKPLSVGDDLVNPSGNTNYKGEELTIKPVEEEILLWFNRFNIK